MIEARRCCYRHRRCRRRKRTRSSIATNAVNCSWRKNKGIEMRNRRRRRWSCPLWLRLSLGAARCDRDGRHDRAIRKSSRRESNIVVQDAACS